LFKKTLKRKKYPKSKLEGGELTLPKKKKARNT